MKIIFAQFDPTNLYSSLIHAEWRERTPWTGWVVHNINTKNLPCKQGIYHGVSTKN